MATVAHGATRALATHAIRRSFAATAARERSYGKQNDQRIGNRG
jgi:hypothetical protein